MECCQGSIVAPARIALPRCLPKASAKVRQILKLTNKLRRKIQLFLNFFKRHLIFNKLQKQQKSPKNKRKKHLFV